MGLSYRMFKDTDFLTELSMGPQKLPFNQERHPMKSPLIDNEHNNNLKYDILGFVLYFNDISNIIFLLCCWYSLHTVSDVSEKVDETKEERKKRNKFFRLSNIFSLNSKSWYEGEKKWKAKTCHLQQEKHFSRVFFNKQQQKIIQNTLSYP